MADKKPTPQDLLDRIRQLELDMELMKRLLRSQGLTV